MSADPKPWIKITPSLMEKMALATALMATGMYYLTTGRTQADVSRMITGAVLSLASVILFAI